MILDVEYLKKYSGKNYQKLRSIGIVKIGDLALSNRKFIIKRFGKFGKPLDKHNNIEYNNTIVFQNV